jgi:NTE family protein
MKERLRRLVDFGRLNGGDVRISVATTDLETGDPVVFDSATRRIEMDHLLASSGFLPEFAPVEIGGRWLADGGFSINAPFDSIFEDGAPGALTLLVIDLYARDGKRPKTLESVAA